MNPRWGWRWPDLVDEAWRRVGGVTVLTAAFLAATTGVLGVGIVSRLAAAAEAERALEIAGLDVTQVVVPDGETLDAASCARLGSSDAVAASGAYFGEAVGTPGTWITTRVEVPVLDVSLGALHVWWPEAPPTGGVFVGPDYAAATGLEGGAQIAIGGSVVVLSGVLPDRVAPAELRASLVRIVPAVGQASQCWLRVDRHARGVSQAIAESAFPESAVVAVPFVRATDLTADPEAVLDSQALRLATAGAIVLTGLAVAVRAFILRGEFAIYRVTGTSRRELLVMAQLQALMLLVPAWTSGIGLTLVFFAAQPILGTSPSTLWFVLAPLVSVGAAAVVLLSCADLVVASRPVLRNGRDG